MCRGGVGETVMLGRGVVRVGEEGLGERGRRGIGGMGGSREGIFFLFTNGN